MPTTEVDPDLESIDLDETLRPSRKSGAHKVSFWKRRGVVLAALLLAIIAIAYGAIAMVHALTHESTDDAFIDGHIISIAPKIAGKIVAVHVTDNQFVKKGELLFEIDPRDAEAALAQKKAALNVARAKKKNAEMAAEQAQAHVRTLEAGYAAAEANTEAAAADAKKQRSDLQRNKTLIAGGAISKQDYEHSAIDTTASEATLESKKKTLEAARAYAEEAQKAAGSALAEKDAATADVDQAEAALRQQELQVSYTKVVAPEDGRVTNKAVEPGDYVQIGQALMALVPREVWVTANYKETQLTQMRPGEPAEVEVDAYPERTLHGHVDSVQAGSGARFSLLPPENATGNFVKVVQRVPVKIVLDEQPGVQETLGPGMSAVPDVQVKPVLGTAIVVAVGAVIAIFLVVTAALLWLARNHRLA